MSTMSQANPHDVIIMEVTLPKDMNLSGNLKVAIKFQSRDIHRTWMDFFEEYNKDIFNFLQSNPGKHAIQGRRNKVADFMLDSSIREFINSFKRTLNIYRARIAQNPNISTKARSVPNHGQQMRVINTRRAALLRTPVLAAPAGGNESGRGTGGELALIPDLAPCMPVPGTKNSPLVGSNLQPKLMETGNPRPTNGTAPATQSERIPTSGREFWNQVGADSMVGAVGRGDESSVATQGQLELQGGTLKKNILRQIGLYTDNLGLVQMKQELQAKIANGSWVRFSRKHPHTSGILVLALGLTFPLTPTRQ